MLIDGSRTQGRVKDLKQLSGLLPEPLVISTRHHPMQSELCKTYMKEDLARDPRCEKGVW